MRNAAKVLILASGLAMLAACNKQQDQNQAATQEMSLDDNLSSSGADSNAQIETLPPDESSTTPSGELNEGQDSPDVNAVGNGY
ncbi:MAG TPA: hypothetical protein VF750_07670 [Sphingomicrobium sp.]